MSIKTMSTTPLSKARFLFQMVIFILLNITSNIAHAGNIVATIGDKAIITSDELESNIRILILLHNPKLINDARLHISLQSQVLNDLINDKLFILHAQKSGIKLNEIDISHEMETAKKSLNSGDNLDLYLQKNQVKKKYLKEKMLAQVVKNIITYGSIDITYAKEISEKEIDIKLKELNKKRTPENVEYVKNFITHRRVEQAQQNVLSLLRKLYYVEVLQH